jgi:hypothetical protein
MVAHRNYSSLATLVSFGCSPVESTVDKEKQMRSRDYEFSADYESRALGWQSARPRVKQPVRILSWLSSSAATTVHGCRRGGLRTLAHAWILQLLRKGDHNDCYSIAQFDVALGAFGRGT